MDDLPVQDFAESFLGSVMGDTLDFWENSLTPSVGSVLLAAFLIVVGFVAYKLIKRAINKA